MPNKWYRAMMISFFCLLPLSLVGCDPDAPTITAEDVATEDVVTWIEETAYPLDTTEMVEDSSDLEWLRDAVGNARVVGLGDQTNGTKEFLTLKNRITEFLIEEMGFSTIAITFSSWGHSLTADRFVSEGKGRAKSVRENLTHPFSLSGEFLNIILWAGRYKSYHPEVPLHFVGLNSLSPHASFEWCKNILLGAGFTFPQASLRTIERLDRAHPKLWGDLDERSKYFSLAEAFVDEVLEILPEYRFKLSALELEIIRRMPRALEQHKEYLQIVDAANESNAAGWRQETFDFYNQCMAENFSWWVDVLGEDTKIILWGHNSQIAEQWDEAGIKPLGQLLAAHYGEQYVSLGFSTGEGIASAVRYTEGKYEWFSQSLVPAPIEDSYETVLCATSIADYALDLRILNPTSDEALWMNNSRPFKLLGELAFTVHPHLQNAYATLHTLPEMFDLIVHLQFTRGIDIVY